VWVYDPLYFLSTSVPSSRLLFAPFVAYSQDFRVQARKIISREDENKLRNILEMISKANFRNNSQTKRKRRKRKGSFTASKNIKLPAIWGIQNHDCVL
jgi:hypothetical protein